MKTNRLFAIVVTAAALVAAAGTTARSASMNSVTTIAVGPPPICEPGVACPWEAAPSTTQR